MSRRRIVWLAVVVTAVGAGLLALIVHLTAPQEVTLPDGTRVTVRSVTFSRNPKYCFGNPLQKLGAKIPGKLGKKLAGNSVSDLGRFDRPVLAIWFSCETNIPRALQLMDASGRPWTDVFFPAARGNLAFITCDVWPRRDNSLTIDLYAKYSVDAKPDGRMVVPNPAYGSYPRWKPESFPATRQVGETEFTLQAVKVERIPTPSRNTKYLRTISITTTATEQGKPSGSWEPVSLAMTDATGNTVERLSTWMDYPDVWKWPAIAGEDAVKLRVEFMKTNGFASNEVFVLRGVPVPGPHHFITNLPAGRLFLRTSMNYVEVVAPASSGAIANWSSRHFVVLSVFDDRGIQVTYPRPMERASFPYGAKWLDVTVAAPPTRWAEWIVPAGGTTTNTYTSWW